MELRGKFRLSCNLYKKFRSIFISGNVKESCLRLISARETERLDYLMNQPMQNRSWVELYVITINDTVPEVLEIGLRTGW